MQQVMSSEVADVLKTVEFFVALKLAVEATAEQPIVLLAAAARGTVLLLQNSFVFGCCYPSQVFKNCSQQIQCAACLFKLCQISEKWNNYKILLTLWTPGDG